MDPEELLARARLFERGELDVPAPRDAATVVLLRDSPRGPEVYLLRRVTGMAFAGGMHVFPGGSVDPADADASTAWAGPPASQWAQWFGASEPLARALVCAAVRETFEECGVLLAGQSPDHLLEDVSSDGWEAERAALEAREQSLSQLLERRGLVLRADLLQPLAHWLTPSVEKRRFDTRFFLAELPPGQTARDVGGEADERVWLPAAEALGGSTNLMPPTRVTLEDLLPYRDVASALGRPPGIRVVRPEFVIGRDGTGVLRIET